MNVKIRLDIIVKVKLHMIEWYDCQNKTLQNSYK